MKYALMIAGLLVMCVPEEADLMRFVVQGAFGLTLFLGGILLAMGEEDYA